MAAPASKIQQQRPLSPTNKIRTGDNLSIAHRPQHTKSSPLQQNEDWPHRPMCLRNWKHDSRTPPTVLPTPYSPPTTNMGSGDPHPNKALRQPGGPATHYIVC